ncbi:MAG: hypothetical protein ABW162_12540 [Candidatus Sedimenticola sp. PURPLELP]
MSYRGKVLGRSLVSFMLAVFLAEAQAADFTFNVPVELHNIHPDTTHVRVYCNVTSTPTWTNNPFVKIASGLSGQHSIAAGEFNSTITLALTAYSGKDPSSGRSYRCGLNFKTNGAWILPTSDPNHPPDNSQPLKFATTGTF